MSARPPQRGERGFVAGLGAGTMQLAKDAGGIALILVNSAATLVPPRVEWDGFQRSLRRFGTESLLLITGTAFLSGVIVLLMAAIYVQRYGASRLVGWGTGVTALREVGPVMIGLMFSGRVGSRNAAELATMQVTEQIDALRALAIDPYSYLVIPRLFAMIVALLLLTIIGDLVAIAGGALTAWLILDVSFSAFWESFVTDVHLSDLFAGLLKAGFFGAGIGVVSCHFGLSVRGGAAGVGRAVNKAVVGAALSVIFFDNLLTWAWPP